MNRIRRAITLVETIVVIAVIGVLIAMLVPAVQKVRENASRLACANKIKQIAAAVHSFHEREKRLPYNQYGGQFGIGRDSKAWSWLARLLPDIDRAELFARGDIANLTLSASPMTSEKIGVFLCPSDPSSQSGPRFDAGNLKGIPVGQTNYKGVGGANWGDLPGDKGVAFDTDWRNPGVNGSFDGHSRGDGMFYRVDYKRRLKLTQIGDGTSNTFMIGEDVPGKTWWCSWPYSNNATGTCAIPPNARQFDGTDYPPYNWQNNESFRSQHLGGLQFGVADGSVRFVANNISLKIYRAFATINGGELASLP